MEDILGILNQKMLQSILDCVTDRIFVKDIEGKYVMANQAMLDGLGLIREEVVGKHDHELFPKEAYSHIENVDKKVFRGEVVIDEHGHYIGPHFQILNITKSPIKNSDGEILGIIGVARDITKYKKELEKLLESEELFKALFQNNPSMLFAVDENGITKDVNKKGASQLGFQADELCGYSVLKVFPRKNHQAVLNQIKLCLENPKKDYEWEIEKETKDGRIIWVLEKARVIKDPMNPNKELVFIVCEDITDRKEAEQSLRESEEMFRKVFESSTDGELIIDESGVFIAANKKASEILEREDDIIGKRPYDLSPRLQPDGVSSSSKAEELLKEAEKKGNITFEWTHEKSDNSNVCVEITLTSFFQKGKKFFHVSWRDLTEKKKLEAQLLQAQKMEAIGTLAGGIAHDFNNILQAIIGYTSLALASNDVDRMKNKLQFVIEAATRAAELTKQLLTFSRKDDIQVSKYSMKILLNDLKKLLKRLIGENIEFEVEYSDEDIHANVDSAKLGQAIMNLIVNAKDAVQPDKGRIKISLKKVKIKEGDLRLIEDCQPGDYACISVSDNGHGIDPEIINNMFDPFFTTKETGRGTGLGLAIVYGITRQHGGFVEVKSVVDMGTEFRLFIPIIKNSGDVESSNIYFYQDSKGKGESILFVEDDPSIRGFVKAALSGNGYEVELADTGMMALESFSLGKTFSLVLTDVVMPGGMNGLKCAEIIRGFNPKIKIVVTSGYSDREVPTEEIKKCGYQFLRKPFGLEELLKTIREELDKE